MKEEGMPSNRTEISGPPNGEVLLPAPAEAPVAPSDAVDMAMLTSFEEVRIEGEPDLVIELIDLYLEDASAKIDALREALATSDETTLKRSAHSLRGSSSSLGAHRMAALCEEVELTDRNSLLRKAGELLTSFEQAFEGVRVIFAAERQRRIALKKISEPARY
jgi:HPt (histidine-containing phosphotransfer) domain-containing protein